MGKHDIVLAHVQESDQSLNVKFTVPPKAHVGVASKTVMEHVSGKRSLIACSMKTERTRSKIGHPENLVKQSKLFIILLFI